MGNKQASTSKMFVKSKLKYVLNITGTYIPCGSTRWRSWLRHRTTNRKVWASIPDGVTGILHSYNPSGRTMALGSTQPLTAMSTRNISWGGICGWCVEMTLPISCADCLELWGPHSPGTLLARIGLYRECFTMM